MRRAVIIDDEPWTRNVIKSLAQWEKLGIELVGEASDGESGLALIRSVRPDIVITDVSMPRLNGIDLLKQLREDGILVPVLIISGYDDFSYVRSALKLGVTDYLLKPIKAQELNQQLRCCLDALGEAQSGPAADVPSAGFFAEGWEEQYFDVRRELELGLQLGRREAVERQFSRLLEIIRTREGRRPPNAIMIGIYYALLIPLQRHIEAIGASREELLSGKSGIFVFGQNKSLEEMLDHVQDLYLTAMQARASRQRRGGLDIEEVCRFVREYYAQGVTLEQAADAFHVSKEYLSKAFKAHQKEGFTEYLTGLRMKRAHELIVREEVPLKEVGALVGYFDLAHFYKSFKKFFGKTPGEVRKGLKSDKISGP